MVSGVTRSAAMTRSPSFSRYSSSTKTIMWPKRSSARASSTLQNPSVVLDMRFLCKSRNSGWLLRARTDKSKQGLIVSLTKEILFLLYHHRGGIGRVRVIKSRRGHQTPKQRNRKVDQNNA